MRAEVFVGADCLSYAQGMRHPCWLVCFGAITAVIATSACPREAPPIEVGEDGAEGEGEGEGEGEPDRQDIIAAICARFEECDEASVGDCTQGITASFADLDADGCVAGADALEDFYACAVTLRCSRLAGDPPGPEEPCGEEFEAADDAIDACGATCAEFLGADDGCDCGCGIDPDCGAGGCADVGCSEAACDFCYDAAGAEVDCG